MSSTIKRMGLGMFVLGVAMWGHARYRTYERLYKKLGKSDLAVVMLYDDSREIKKDSVIKDKIERLEDMFKYTGRDDLYKEADIEFIRVDVSEERYADIEQHFQVKNIPAFLVMKNSVPIKDDKGVPVQLQGYDVTRDALKRFIMAHLSSAIEQVLQEKKKIRERKLEEAAIRRVYWAPYWGGYWPNYYWRGPYWRSRYYW